MDHKENLMDKELSLTVVLPGGAEKMTTVHGSKPLMDLLVTLCAKYHLNPSGHTLELVTTNRNNIKLKPNALIGTLDAEKIIIKSKSEDKNKKTSPQMPEATVRMVINYKQTQKTILRVSPRVPLAELLPAICEKCEFEVESTVLLKDVKSLAPLDLSASLNDYAIREVYARDTQVPGSPVCPSSPDYPGLVTPGKDKNQKEVENKGLFSMFRRSKKSKPEKATTASAPSSPVLPQSRPRPHSMALPSSHSSPFGTDVPKKRRAPQPPILVSQQSCPTDFSPRQRLYSEPCTRLNSTDQTPVLSRGSSTESSLKRTKRKAPPPPASPSVAAPEPLSPDDLQGIAPAITLEEIKEQEEINSPAMFTATSAVQDQTTTHNASDPVDTVPIQTAVDVSIKENGDLSTENNGQMHSEVNDSTTPLVMEKVDVEDLTELADTSEPSTCEEGPCNGSTVDSDTLPSPARLRDAETQASPSPPPPLCMDSTAPAEGTDCGETSLHTVTQTTAEDAQVQTDSLPPTAQRVDIAPEKSSPPVLSESGKKDMATLTDDLEVTLNLDVPSSPAKLPPSEPELKPKASNELTRDYIPKVGMTTYTIVPQKTLDKLRYFEVALTLEAAPQNLQEDNHELEGSTTEKSEQSTTEKSEQSNKFELENCHSNNTVNGSIQESTTQNYTSSNTTTTSTATTTTATTVDSHAGALTKVKEIKIPPATKPKPGSFRLQQHKKTPGYYVTSAAEKNQLPATSSTNQKPANDKHNKHRETLPPPPLPPLQSPVDGAIVLSPKPNVAAVSRQTSLQQPSFGLSLEKLRSFAAPRPYSPSTPSRFAQAVSSAVKKQSSSPSSPRSPCLSPSFSPVRSPSFSPVKKESPSLEPNERVDAIEERTEKISTIGPAPHTPEFSEIVEVEEETHV
ncbi:unnamed protein product [Knipowitschia caucasica]